MAEKWLAWSGPFTAGSWQALNGRQMATLKRAICGKKWLAMLPFLPFVALTETTNGPFMSCLLGIFHNDTHSHFILFHAYLARINWISLIDYDIPKITMMSFIVLSRIITTTKLSRFVKESCPYHWLCNDLHIYKSCCIESQYGDTCSCPCTQLCLHSIKRRRRNSLSALYNTKVTCQ